MYACDFCSFYLIDFQMGACAITFRISDEEVVVAEGKRLINIIIVCFGYPQTNV